MKELFALKRFEECLRLAERLSEVAALNLGVQLMLLKATSMVHGRLAARAKLERIDLLIRADLQGLPEVRLELLAPKPEQLN